jgi:anthranilate/para-aminobenzoate synthase component II
MLNRTKIYIIDFEDSFTYNIATELYAEEKRIEIISHLDFFSEDFFSIFFNNIVKPTAVILGPGPGSPEEYRHYFSKIIELKYGPSLFLMGICLGHQLLGLIDGLSVRSSFKPIHGEQIKINFKNQIIQVQRYNSLALFESRNSSEEIQIRQWERGVSYQFHPESIGTEKKSLFFKDLLDFIH